MKLSSLLRLAAALFITIVLSLATVSPALALDLNPQDYFQLTYNPVTFDKSSVSPGEVFHTTLKGRATCIKDLPLPFSEVSIKSQVIARPAAGGADLTLNAAYAIDINPLPKKSGEYYDINQSVTLQFPAGAPSGDYTVIGKLIEAKVTIKMLISYTQDVTGSFPQESVMGSIKCGVPSTMTATPATTSPAATAPMAALPSTSPPTGGSTYSPSSSALPIEKFPFTTVAIIALLVVVVVLLIIVIRLLQRRGG
jgi:hypothetical protein